MKVEITNWQLLEALSSNDFLDEDEIMFFLTRIISKLPDYSNQKATTREAQNLCAEMQYSMTALLQKLDFENAKSVMKWLEGLMKSRDYEEYLKSNNNDTIKF